MLSYILAICLVVIVLLCITLRKAYFFLPAKELKRQAEAGEPSAVVFWRAVTYGSSLRLFLWLVIGFASTLCVVLLARVAPPLLGFVAVALLLLSAFAWLPASRLTGYGVRAAEFATPAVVWLVGTLDPVLHNLSTYLDRRRPGHVHTGVYVREDLLELIEKQKNQNDNRLTIEELDIAAAALQFGQKKISDIMVPRKSIHCVDGKDTISPVYLDELHKTLLDVFPVYDATPENFIGVLYLRDLTDVSKGKGAKGKVKDHMSKGIVYVHENDSLADALHAFYLSKKQVFLVVNSFEEYVGIVSVEEILHALLGKPGEHEFDQHESKPAVAARHSKKPKHIDEVIEAEEIAPPTPDEAVEPETQEAEEQSVPAESHEHPDS